ncbi:sugar transferase [Candidatus Uabimicrobium amorphum]|uniref:Putative sugar transferase EpsL n=1 Tax=Uabimicrobium amorphum TaxID=2596890 RepID=A0A5S9F416_UABAM|nr:sugar transferase [Candidatus Uabimicrobium amorphum]BBM84723.1 putative sugar transferase EpsL [Candidatus Uabimicrobium amorphum]
MFYSKVKRILDLGLATFLLILSIPLLVFIVGIVAVFMGRPILFSQQRVGLRGNIFTIYKFRTMNNKTGANGELLPDHERLTLCGKWMRKLSVDELPQLYNILKGEMSFIGPRPLLVEYLPLYNKEQMRRHDVLPGITGLAQVKGRNAISWEKKFTFDVDYVDNISFALDCKIFFLTFIVLLQTKNVHEGSPTRFMGNNGDKD